MMSHQAMREAMIIRRTAVDNGDDGYNSRPDYCYGVCQSDVKDVWIASDFLEDVEAVPLDNDL
jgi:hypothetical protein